jgi:hypothetical protein
MKCGKDEVEEAGKCIKELTLKPLGEDFWGRETFENVKSKVRYAMVDGKLHPTTTFGEPIAPIRKDIKVTILKE